MKERSYTFQRNITDRVHLSVSVRTEKQFALGFHVSSWMSKLIPLNGYLLHFDFDLGWVSFYLYLGE